MITKPYRNHNTTKPPNMKQPKTILIVVDDDQKPVGLVTDRDLTVRAVAAARDAKSTIVRELMTAQPRVVTEGTPIEDALALMRSGKFRRLPVVGDDRRLVGLVTAAIARETAPT